MNLPGIPFTRPTDEIFEKCNISTIKALQNDLEEEITKKKNEIRVLVGQKYRDFVDVSEKIHYMDDIIKKTTQEIEAMPTSLSTLTTICALQKIQRKNIPKFDHTIEKERSLAVLRKLLINIENQLWVEIEFKKFLTAAIILQFTIYIRTVLNLETTCQVEQDSTINHGVWDLILRFPSVIDRFIEEELQSVNLTSSTACECFCSLTLLQNLCCVDVMKKFLTIRLKTLEFILSKENTTQNVRSRFCNSLLTIIKSLEILYHCFRQTTDKNGEYWENLESLTTGAKSTVFDCIDKDMIEAYGEIYIPSDVKNFKVKVTNLTRTLNLSDICKMVDDWMQEVKEQIVVQLPNYLNLINSLQNLNALKQPIPMDDFSWMQISKYFNLNENVLLWEELYEPLIADRAKVLLSQRWNVLFARVRQKIESCSQDFADTNLCELEYDLQSFLWMDESPRKSLRSTGLSVPEDVRVKRLGLSQNTGKLCAFIESLVVDIVNELACIRFVEYPGSQTSRILRNHQQSCCIAFVERLVNFSKELLNVEEVSEKMMLFLARFLSGVLFLCPSLKECVLLDDKGDGWLLLTAKLSEENLNIWRKWSSQVMLPILSEIRSFDRDILSARYKLKYLTKWDAVKITEENDGEDGVSFELRVPLQASCFVQNILNELAVLIGRTLPPKIILIEMRDNMVMEILRSIERAGQQPVHNTILLQFLFDVKYLTLLLVPEENETLNELSKGTIDGLQMKIDPVDLDSILPTLSTKVQYFVYNTQGIFGSLMINKPRVSIEKYGDSCEDPNTIYIAPNDTPSLPLITLPSMYPS